MECNFANNNNRHTLLEWFRKYIVTDSHITNNNIENTYDT